MTLQQPIAFLAIGAMSGGCGLVLGLDEFQDAGESGGTGGSSVSSITGAGAGGCMNGERDCVGDAPRECASGAWVAQAPCGGATPLCAGGQCVSCEHEERGCAGNKPRQCVQGDWVEEAACADPYPGCRQGTCVPASCQGGGPGAGLNCGLDGNADCCASAAVTGGMFNRMNDAVYPATVSDFQLDTYEITVGRFRAFVEAGQGTRAAAPPSGAGANPAIAQSGWNGSWNTQLLDSRAELKAALRCEDHSFWTDNPGENEAHPMSCFTWFEVFAFCTWDGGRLSTEAEWNYAAAGGAEQREYPWGPTIDEARAAYSCLGDVGSGGCSMTDFLRVGMKSPAGDSRWGNADMAGNIGEWVLDLYGIPPVPCNDCAQLTGNASNRAVRGGTAWSSDLNVTTWSQSAENPTNRNSFVGARCARAPRVTR